MSVDREIETTSVQPDYADKYAFRHLINAFGRLVEEMTDVPSDGSGWDLCWFCDDEEDVERVTEAIKSLGLRVEVCDHYAPEVVERVTEAGGGS